MSRIVIIDSCNDCPHFDIKFSTDMANTCEKLKRIIPYDKDTYSHPIPDDCPLERVKK